MRVNLLQPPCSWGHCGLMVRVRLFAMTPCWSGKPLEYRWLCSRHEHLARSTYAPGKVEMGGPHENR